MVKILIVQHLANDPRELVKHEPMPGKEVPLLIMLGVRGLVWVGRCPECNLMLNEDYEFCPQCS
jgi:hypothetical protein